MPLSQYKQQLVIYRRAFEWIRQDTSRILIAGLFSFVLSVTSGVVTYSFLPVFQVVFESPSTGVGINGQALTQQANRFLLQAAGEGSKESQLARLIMVIVVLSLVTTGLGLLVDYLFIEVQARGTERLRRLVFAHLCELPMTFYNKTKTGTLISRVENDIGGTVAMVTGSIADFTLNIFLAIALIAILVIIQPYLTLIVLPVLVLVWAALMWVGRWVQHNRQRILALQADIVALMQEFFGGMRIIKGFSAEGFEQRRWRDSVVYWRKLEVVNSLNKVLPRRLSELVALFILAAVLLAGGRMVIQATLSVSELLLFFVVLMRFQQPASNLSRVWLHIQDGMAYTKRTLELLREPAERLTGTKPLPRSFQTIQFQNVFFDYGEEAVLKNISFSLARGQVIALVGPSGSGKSTLADLLIRFYEPTAGEIRIDGVLINDIALRPYRALFGIVSQDTFLFHDTIYNNITYALPSKVTKAQAVAAAVAANADGFIQKLPAGYDTIIGDRGVRLSGGQRQRIAIARAIIRNPQILIFDEATSSLDTKSERAVQAAIDRLVRDRTTLVIAHRLSTVQKANRILTIHDGQIVEAGTHQELLGRDGLYRHLWQLQSV